MSFLRYFLVGCSVVVFEISAWSQPGTPATSVVGYPGAGVIQAGDVWESFLPQGYGPNFSEAPSVSTLGVRRLIQMGNFDRNWTTPATHWPAAFPITPYWLKDAFGIVYDPDTTWNRSRIGGTANPSFFLNAAPVTGALYSNFAYLTYRSTVAGASDPVRHYSIEPYFVDGTTRQLVVYEAAWPTNLGVDVTIRAHGIAAPNWDNLNDYVIVEIQMKNTGYMDMNMDGVAEQVSHNIKAIAFQVEEQAYMSVSSYGCGGRCVNDIVPAASARQAGWVDDADSAGNPWAFSMVFPSATTLNPTPGTGNTDIGFNGGTTKNYMDIHHGWVMLDVKAGGLPTDRSQSTASLPSKQTLFGSHPIGVGPHRGWYMTGGSSYWAGVLDDPRKAFYATTGAWYQNGGILSHNTDFTLLDLAPNANFFSGGSAGDVTTFVPNGTGARPKGDYKSTNHFDQVSFEDGSADATTPYPNGWGKWTQGCAHTENFDDDMFTGVGPFDLKTDSTITIVFATVAGYRLEGIQRSVRAARFAYENNFNIPKPPPLPDLKVVATPSPSITIDWDNRAEGDPQFAGYKIWRAARSDSSTYLDEGIRIVDRYQEQMIPGPRPPDIVKPINPKFDAQSKMLANATHGQYLPDTWGTWKLVKTVPVAALGSIAPSVESGFIYTWADTSVEPGSSYWYYVSAYTSGTYVGPGGDVTDRIETHYTNRNGASGLWVKTFPFGSSNANFPQDAAGKKAIGAVVTLGTTSVASKEQPLPVRCALSQNYPNPCNPSSDIRYQISEFGIVRLSVYDILGREMAVLVNERKAPGSYEVTFDGSGLSSGVYFYRLQMGEFVATKRLLLLK